MMLFRMLLPVLLGTAVHPPLPGNEQRDEQLAASPRELAGRFSALVAELGPADPKADLATSSRQRSEAFERAHAMVLATHDAELWATLLASAAASSAQTSATWQRTQAGDWLGWAEDMDALVLREAETASPEERDLEVVLEATFERSGKDPLPVELRFAQTASGWRLLDMQLEGHSPWSARAQRLMALASLDASQFEPALQAEAERFVEGPLETVAGLQQQLLRVMRAAPELDFEGRRIMLSPCVLTTHDLPVSAYLTLRRSWPELDDEQRLRFTRTFERLSIATYARHFKSFAGERFESGEPRPGARGGYVVPTLLVLPDGERVALEYILHRRTGRWMILNVLADGVSDLALKTSEYDSVLAEHGYEDLLRRLELQIEAKSREPE